MVLRWKKNPRPSGLAGICCGPLGSTLRIDGEVKVATVSALNWSTTTWYWVAGWGHPSIPHKNTCEELLRTEAEAKTGAMAYVRECLTANALAQGPGEEPPSPAGAISSAQDGERKRHA